VLKKLRKIGVSDDCEKNIQAAQENNLLQGKGGASLQFQQTLHQRAQLLAEEIAEISRISYDQYLRFRLGDQENYGIPYQYLVSTIQTHQITPLPGVPVFVKGVVNLHGEILAVFDLKYFFGIEGAASEQQTNFWILIVQGYGLKFGFLVDEVIGNEDYIVEEIEAALPSADVLKIEYVQGILKNEVTIVNVEAILKDKGLRIKI
jgi:purine-binding chemotaxis protein CheW